MKTKIKQHIILKKDCVINGKKIERGRVIKNEGWITSSCGLVLSNFPTVDSEKLWKEVLKKVEQGDADYIYSHIDYLEEGEEPKSCKGCPHQSFTVGYFDNKDEYENRMSCNALGMCGWYHKKVSENAIKKHYYEGTKPMDCPKINKNK